MSNNMNIIAPALGGTALVLGLAFGLASREYRGAEIEAVRNQAAIAIEAADVAKGKVDGLEARIAEAAAMAEAQAAEIAALQEQLEAAKQAQVAAAAAEPETPAPAEEPAGEEAGEQVASGPEALGDPAHGAEVFKLCSGCHQVGGGAKDRVGPQLNGIFGRRAGSIDGFKYSKAMDRAFSDGLVWDYEHLDAYIENPKALITGTRMSFRGIEDADDRHDVIAYLRSYSDNPQDIPESAPTAIKSEVELPPEILAIVGDRDYGEYLASECLTCHKQDGGDDGIPSITFWPTEDFVVAMHAYKQKLRPHPVMQMMAGRLSDEEIAALAAYFAELE